MIKKILIFFSFFLYIGCSNSKESIPDSSVSDEVLISYVKEKTNSSFKEIKLVFVIPNAGCNGCVNSSQSYLIDNLMTKNLEGIVVVYTDIKDFKRMKLLLGPQVSILSHSNVIVDRTNEFKRKGFISFYPEVYLFENKKVKYRAFVKPENSEVFGIIKEHLAN